MQVYGYDVIFQEDGSFEVCTCGLGEFIIIKSKKGMV